MKCTARSSTNCKGYFDWYRYSSVRVGIVWVFPAAFADKAGKVTNSIAIVIQYIADIRNASLLMPVLTE